MIQDVLIVDDSLAIRKIVQRTLRHAELPLRNVHEAADGQEALTVLEANSVDLAFVDINMPKMDGLELLGRIKADARWRDLPVVMVTTEAGETKVMTALQLGAAGYVLKPFSPEQFRKVLAPIL